MSNSFEVLEVVNSDNKWKVVGTAYSNMLKIDANYTYLHASFLTIQKVKELLACGKTIYISKILEYPEVQIKDLIYDELDVLEQEKNIAINNLNSLIHQMIIGVSVIDAITFLKTYMQLINAGFFITDKNREDKYFEIIDAAQSIEEPQQLPENATFEEEREYVINKQKYDDAQENLQILEKYLNAYDNLDKVSRIYDILNTAKNKIVDATAIDEIKNIEIEFKKQIADYNEKK